MILPYTKTNKTGEKEQFWTHSSYLDKEQINKLAHIDQSRKTYRNYFGLFSLIAGVQLASLPAVSKLVPPKIPGLAVGALVGVVGYLIGDALLVSGKHFQDLAELSQRTTLPLWKNKRNVVNIDRAFFHLDESRNNQPNLLYHGLTAENAARIFPDQVVGPAPKAPSHGHGHGHQHEHKAHH